MNATKGGEDKKLILAAPTGEIDLAGRLEHIQDILKAAEENKDEALSENTRRAYAGQWRAFTHWCEALGLPMFPVDDRVLLAYLTDRQRQGASLSTLNQAYSAIREEHRMRGVQLPSLEGQLYRSWTGARRKAAREQEVEKARALSVDFLRKTVAACKGKLGPRDKALLLIGWCGALRREEIVNLDIRDVRVVAEGLRIIIRKSKTDQMGVGHEIGIARAGSLDMCPVAAWEALQTEDPREPSEPAFISKLGAMRLDPYDVARILIRRMKQAGLPTEDYSAHSLRAGCITAAAEAGHSLEAIQRQSRHKSLEVLLGYIRTATLFKGNVTEGLL